MLHFSKPVFCSKIMEIFVILLLCLNAVGKIVFIEILFYFSMETYCSLWVLARAHDHDFHHRQKRQMPFCSNGVDRAVAGCFQNGTCNRYRCEAPNMYCCNGAMPTCTSNGQPAAAACVSGACTNFPGTTCQTISNIQVCCPPTTQPPVTSRT